MAQKQKVTLEEKYGKRVTTRGLLHFSDVYYKTFLEVIGEDDCDSKYYLANYFLALHSIELSLKSVLRHTKYTLDDLHKFGHNLQKIMEEICTNELIYISKEEKTLIDLTNQMYKDKEFEYITLGYKNPPKILLLHSTTSSLLDKATKYISTPK